MYSARKQDACATPSFRLGGAGREGDALRKVLQEWAEAWPAGQRCKGLASEAREEDSRVLGLGSLGGVATAL